MLIAILIAIVVYLIALSSSYPATTEAEMRRMPMGTKLVKSLHILRIYR